MEEEMKENQRLTLSEFSNRIKEQINGNSELLRQWVKAEISDLRESGGHCYMELLEKDVATGKTMAKMRAQIWRGTVSGIKKKFVDIGQPLATGMKVLVQGSATYHEQFGLSMVIHDIDANYTLGDMERLRKEILDKLTKKGVIDFNKNLPLPLVPQRIAVISSKSAAGYGDFMNQLHGNVYRLQFYTCLFAATMQGEQTAPTVIAALDRIEKHKDKFDCVVIIRGGGATTDLNSFDNYDLAKKVATFALPIITGIGHERDETVLDKVSAVPVKTPTAVAEWLIVRGADALAKIERYKNEITSEATNRLNGANQQLSYLSSAIPMLAKGIVERNKIKLSNYVVQIPTIVRGKIATASTQLQALRESLKVALNQVVERERIHVERLEDQVNLLSPRNILNRGYTLMMSKGQIITNIDDVEVGDTVTTHFANGKIRAKVEEKIKK